VFLQNKGMVKGSLVGAKNSPILKLTSYMWIKKYSGNLLLTSMNRCALSEIYKEVRDMG
jgi:hypothetical protein